MKVRLFTSSFLCLTAFAVATDAATTIDFNDPSSFPTGWLETAAFSQDAYALTPDGGLSGTGAVFNPSGDTAYYTYVYQTPVGKFDVGEISAWVYYVDNPDNHSGNPFVLGLTTASDAFIDFGAAGDDYIKLVFNNRSSIPTEIRPEIYGTLSSQQIRTGAGHPETFVPFVDSSWYHVKLRILKTEGGEWNLEAVWDLYNGDATELVQAEYAKHDYNSIRASDSSPDSRRPALEDVIGPLAAAETLYLFIGGQGLGERGVQVVDNISVSLGEAASDWYGYTVGEDGWVDTGEWMGMVNVASDPWAYVNDLGKYLYIPIDAGWVWVPAE